MKEAYYFSHDANARHDPKILSMRSVYGSEGYGWYWIIIEMLREQENFQIEITKYVWNALAMQTQCNADAMHQFVDDCINEFKLFASDGEYFWSESLKRRMEIRNDKSEKARKAAEARWGKASNSKVSAKSKKKQSDSNADAMQTHSERNAIKESKGKEIKEKDTTTAAVSPIDFYQQNFGVLNPFMGEKLMQWADDVGEELLIEAMKKALSQSKKFNYAEGILRGWLNDNIKTVDDVRAAEKQYKDKKSNPPQNPQHREMSKEDLMFG